LVYDSKDDIRYYKLINWLIKTLQHTGEFAVTEIESLASKEKIRPTAILDELAMTPGVSISFADGKVRWRPKNHKRTLNIEFGRYTNIQGIEVYERLEKAVKEEFKPPIYPVKQIPSNLNENSIRESLVVRALDKYLSPLPDKEAFEVRINREISDEVWNILQRTDGKYVPEKELINICREHGISIGKRAKKELALELYDRGIILV
jgi:hypothetical protein